MSRVAQGGLELLRAQDLEQLLCRAAGWKGCRTQSHGEGEVSKARSGNLSLAGSRVMIICCLCQGFGLHKAVALYVQREPRICTGEEQSTRGKHAAAVRGTSKGLGSLQASGWCRCSRICCTAERIAGRPALSAQRNARLQRRCSHHPTAWRGGELRTSAPEMSFL